MYKYNYLPILILLLVFFQEIRAQTCDSLQMMDLYNRTRDTDIISPVTRGDNLYFIADDGFSHGLYVSDGTTEGTIRLFDWSEHSAYSNYWLYEFNGDIYFQGGLTSGERELKKIDAGNNVSFVRGFDGAFDFPSLGHNGEFYFFGLSGDNTIGVWKTDGTTSGTIRFNSSNFAITGAGAALSRNRMTLFNNEVHFTGDIYNDGQVEHSIWKINPSNGSTTLVDNMSGTEYAVAGLTPLGNQLLFIARNDFGDTIKLWQTNGVQFQATELATLGKYSSSSRQLDIIGLFNNEVYFTKHQTGSTNLELWKTDGTSSGNQFLAQVNAIHGFTIFNGEAYFETTFNNDEVWKTDGTPTGTVQVTVSSAGIVGVLNNELIFTEDKIQADGSLVPNAWVGTLTPSNIYNSPSQDFIRAEHPQYNYELFITDGTLAGTQLLKDLDQRYTGSSYASPPIPAGDMVFFFGEEINSFYANLFKADGSGFSYAHPLSEPVSGYDKDGYRGAWKNDLYIYSSFADNLTKINGTDGTETELTTGLTTTAQGFTSLKDHLVFLQNSSSNKQLWRTDGTVAGTEAYFTFDSEVTSLQTVALTSTSGSEMRPMYVEENGAIAHFYTNNETQLWMTDGTEAGTFMYFDISTIASFSYIGDVFKSGDTYYILVRNSSGSFVSIYTGDGINPPALVVSLNADLGSLNEYAQFRRWAELPNGIVLFRWGKHFYQTDGTTGGTFRLNWPSNDSQNKLIGSNDQGALIRVYSGSSYSYWFYDGNQTTVLSGIPEFGALHEGVELYGDLFFVAGGYLYRLDGSNLIQLDNRRLVHNSGYTSYSDERTTLVEAGGSLFFRASLDSLGAGYGYEIFRYTPCPECVIVEDISSEPVSNTSARISWSPVLGAENYQVRYRLNGTTDPFTTIGTGSPLTSKTISGLSSFRVYEYRVRAKVDGQWCDYSNVQRFFTSTCPTPELSSVTISYPGPDRVKLTWDPLPEAIRYQIRYRQIGTSAWTTIGTAPGNNFKTIAGLTPGVTYQYRIRTDCGGFFSQYTLLTAATTFTMPPLRVASSRLGDQPLLQWYPNPVKDVLIMELNSQENATVVISDMLGRDIHSKELTTGNNQIRLQDLKAGQYIFRIVKNDLLIETHRFVKL